MPLPSISILPWALAISSPLPDTGWRETARPCIDTLLEEAGGEDWGLRDFRDPAAVEDCDPDEASLFGGDRARENPRRRESSRASFSVSGSPHEGARTIARHAAARNGWDDLVELRDDEPGRWRLGYSGEGWRVAAGEMTDTALPPWPRGLPHRALPAGWRAAQGTGESPRPLSAPVPQGVAVGALHARWKAWALRAWNPVETGEEPPWSEAWNLRYSAAGASVSLPWTASLHLADTRIARDGVDTLSERLVAAGLSSPGRGIEVDAALSESGARRGAGGFLAAALRHAFERGGEAALTLRQRSGDWTSAWDPAVAEDAVYAADDSDAPEEENPGAGEIRISGRMPFREEGARRESGFARGEAWSAWNPDVGTSRRGARLALGRRAGEARLEVSGTHRVSRAASGSLSTYRLAQADAEIEGFPRWRASAWRAWNGDGPLRTGMFVGAEPAWRTVRVAPGFRLETNARGRFEGLASLDARMRLGGWNLEASAALPCAPAPDAGATRWRLRVATGR
jgi:hypothetical protein